jgi:hypothetical protein
MMVGTKERYLSVVSDRIRRGGEMAHFSTGRKG